MGLLVGRFGLVGWAGPLVGWLLACCLVGCLVAWVCGLVLGCLFVSLVGWLGMWILFGFGWCVGWVGCFEATLETDSGRGRKTQLLVPN